MPVRSMQGRVIGNRPASGSLHVEYLAHQAAQSLGKLHHDHPHGNDPLSQRWDIPAYVKEGCLVHSFSVGSSGFNPWFLKEAKVEFSFFPFYCTKSKPGFWQYRATPHFHFRPHSSILVFAKEVSSTMHDCGDLMEMQQRWSAEEQKTVGGVKALIQFLFLS